MISVPRRRSPHTLRLLSAVVAALVFASCSSSESVEESALDESRTTLTVDPTTTGEAATTTAPTTVPTTTTSEPTTTTEPSVPLSSGPSMGCAQPEPQDLPTELVTTDGERRTFRIVLPRNYDQADPAPLVFDFHGLGSEGFQQALVSGIDAAAGLNGYVAVIPDGAVNDVLGTRLWNLAAGNDGPLADLAVDDVAFVIELLDLLEAELCIDTARVYSMGLSNGGFFSTVLACELADRIAAVATVAGITHPDDCNPVRPVPVLHFHGTDDDVVPFEGGASSLVDDGGTLGGLDGGQLEDFAESLFQPIETEVDQWAETNGCDLDPTVSEVSPEVERRVFESCELGASVEFYVVEGGGHTWPGSIVMAFIESLGFTTLDVSATQLAFDWFDEHPMPQR